MPDKEQINPKVKKEALSWLRSFLEHRGLHWLIETMSDADRLAQNKEKLIGTVSSEIERKQQVATNQLLALTDTAIGAVQRAAPLPVQLRGKKASKKLAVVEKLTRIEHGIAMLSSEYDASNNRQNTLILECTKRARAELELAMNALLANHTDRAARMADVAWLHVNFGRQLMDAETIEHLLGESKYLDISESRVDPELQAERDFASLEADLLRLRAAIKNQAQV